MSARAAVRTPVVPRGPWALSMRWHDLLFMHWPVPEEVLRPMIPGSLAVDTFGGSAWLGVVPFRMSGVRPRPLPAVERISDFPEINLRTYVVGADGEAGVWFFSLDAASRLAVRLARTFYGLPYFDARMSCHPEGGWVRYESVRTHRGAPPARFAGRYRPRGSVFEAAPGSLEDFLTGRYLLYSAGRGGRLMRAAIRHRPWPLQLAEIDVDRLEMTSQVGLEEPSREPLLHFARYLEVVAWFPEEVG